MNIVFTIVASIILWMVLTLVELSFFVIHSEDGELRYEHFMSSIYHALIFVLAIIHYYFR